MHENVSTTMRLNLHRLSFALCETVFHHLRDECLNMEAHSGKFFGALMKFANNVSEKKTKNPELNTNKSNGHNLPNSRKG